MDSTDSFCAADAANVPGKPLVDQSGNSSKSRSYLHLSAHFKVIKVA